MKIISKFLAIICVSICLFGCSLKGENKYENQIYFVIDSENEIHYDDYLMIKEDGTFDKQTNYGEGYEHFIGKYEFTNFENNKAIKLIVNDYENLPIYFKIENNKIIPYAHLNEDYEKLQNIIKSYYGDTWIIDESNKLEYNVDISL